MMYAAADEPLLNAEQRTELRFGQDVVRGRCTRCDGTGRIVSHCRGRASVWQLCPGCRGPGARR